MSLPSASARKRNVARRLLRCLAIAAGIAAIGLLIRGSSRPIVLNHSLASLLAVSCAIMIAVGSAWLGWSRDTAWSAVGNALGRWFADRERDVTPLVFGLGLTVIVLVQIGVGLAFLSANKVAVDDQADYLRVARDVESNHGGCFHLPLALFGGEFTESNRHPLYVAILAIHPTFEFGKLISQCFGILSTLLIALIGSIWRSRWVGLWAALLLGTNKALYDSASLVACESLLLFLVLLAFGFVLASDRVPFVALVGSGVCLALAYLTKASAFFLAAVTGVCLLIPWRSQAREGSEGSPGAPKRLSFPSRLFFCLVFAISFVAVSSPLLVRNVRVFGTPLYNFNNRLLFEDSFEGGLERPDLGFRGNLSRYLREHTLRQIIIDRLLGGWAMETFVLLRTLGPAPFESERAVFGVVILLAAVFGAAGNPGVGPAAASPRWLLAGWVFVFWLFFAWYQPIAASDRFLLPLVPPIYLYAASGLARWKIPPSY